MQVEMLKDHDHRVKPAVTIAYKEGKMLTVTRTIGNDLIKAGAAREIKYDKPTETEG